ncbi:MAG: nucleotidyl transferase AbiEii/AbiGii toxin family protein [bacterium]
MNKNIKNLPESIKMRLKNEAEKSHRIFAEVLQYYGMERFLYRLSRSSYADKFILKGALMFNVWHVPNRRTTLDIDFLVYLSNVMNYIEKVIKEISTVEVPADGIIFDTDSVRTSRIKEESEYEGIRVKLIGYLDRSRIPLQVDIGFGDPVYPKPRTIEYPSILDLPAPKLSGYTIESVISEKFHAMIQHGQLNSRMKDFYDIWTLMRQFTIDSSALAEALKRTFHHREISLSSEKPLFSKEFYDDQSDRQALWKAFLKKSDIKHAPAKLSVLVGEIESFLMKSLHKISE